MDLPQKVTTDNGLPDYFVCISYVENCMKPMVKFSRTMVMKTQDNYKCH